MFAAVSRKNKEVLYRFDKEKMLRELEAVLQSSEYPPPSMAKVIRDSGYCRKQIEQAFPELCKRISQRYREARKTMKLNRIQNLCNAVQEEMIKLHKEGSYPSRGAIAKNLKNSHLFLQKELDIFWREMLSKLEQRKPN